jgi:hypothetical protein
LSQWTIGEFQFPAVEIGSGREQLVVGVVRPKRERDTQLRSQFLNELVHQAGAWSPPQEQGAKTPLLDGAPGGLGRIVGPYLPAYRAVQHRKAANGNRLARVKQGTERGGYLVGWDAHGLSHEQISRDVQNGWLRRERCSIIPRLLTLHLRALRRACAGRC